MSFDEIMKRALARVPDTQDKREGSVIYDAIAPLAFELANVYAQLDYVEQQAFADTAERENLVRRCAERGITPHEATKAVLKGVFQPSVPIGARFNLEELNYCVISQIGGAAYRVECETPGTAGNRKLGALTPIGYVDGLKSAALTEVLEPAIDSETTQSLRARYLSDAREPAASGNIYDYQHWATEVSGVGAAKALPLWNGAGTVKVLVTNSGQEPAEESLLQKVAAHIEESRPIGAAVTVAAPTPRAISITARVMLASSAYLDDVQTAYTDAVRAYLRTLVFGRPYVSYAVLGSLLLDIEGVTDYDGLLLNGSVANARIGDMEIPVLSEVTLEV